MIYGYHNDCDVSIPYLLYYNVLAIVALLLGQGYLQFLY